MGQDDLLTPAEAAYLDEDGGISEEEEIDELEGFEEEAAEKPASEIALESTNEEDPISEPTYTNEVVEEVAEPIEPLPSSGRYAEVAMTDTVPAELESKLNSLATAFDNSEIDITEYLKQRSLVDRQIMTHQIEEANSQKHYNSWMDAQDNFLNANRQYSNPVLYGALDTAVREVQADPRARGLTPTEIMAAADYLVKDSFGIAQTPKERAAEQKTQTKKPTNELPAVPTLSTVPASSMNSTGVDPFSAIERLTGDDKEAAVARMTPEQYEAYLRA